VFQFFSCCLEYPDELKIWRDFWSFGITIDAELAPERGSALPKKRLATAIVLVVSSSLFVNDKSWTPLGKIFMVKNQERFLGPL